MKDKKQHSLGQKNCSLMFALALFITGGLLASCTQDEFAGGSLLEERALLEPTATNLYESVATPSGIGTRGTLDGDWNGAVYSTVAVRVNGKIKKYDISDVSGNSARLTCDDIADDETDFWWTKSDETKKVDAWYPYLDELSNETTWEVSDKQTFETMAQEDFMYVRPVNMTLDNQKIGFRHLLAKIEINLVSSPYLSNASKVEVFLGGMSKKGKVTIYDYAELYGYGDVCTITPCLVSRKGDNYASYEALIIPLTTGALDVNKADLRVIVDGATYRYELINAFSNLYLKELIGGYRFTFNVTVKEKGLEVKAESSMEWTEGDNGSGSVTLPTEITLSDKPVEIKDNGNYIITGDGTQSITINGSPTINFLHTNITADSPVKIVGGSPKLIISGENTWETTTVENGVIALSDEASVDISGNGTLKLVNEKTLVLDKLDAVLGARKNSTCGDISVSGIRLEISISDDYLTGIGSGWNATCGDIIITDAIVTIAKPTNCAGIGTGINASCGEIRINNSDINITCGNFYEDQPAAIGCGGMNSVTENIAIVKGIYITLKPDQTKADFLNKLTVASPNTDKVGYSYFEGYGKFGTIIDGINWYNADGTEITESDKQ